MASLLSLPTELLVYVARDLESVGDISALSRSCARAYGAVTSTLYRRVKDDPDVLHWAVEKGYARVARCLLAAGADPDVARVQPFFPTDAMDRIRSVEGAPSPQLKRMIAAMDQKAAQTDAEEEEEGEESVARTEADEEVDFSNGDDDDYDDEDDDDGSHDDFWLYEYSKRDESDYESDCDSSEDGDDSSSVYDDHDSDFGDYDDDDSDYALDMAGDGTFPTQYYWTPLHRAASQGHDELVELLLSYGANIHALSRGLCTCSWPVDRLPRFVRRPARPLWMPLHTAICHGHESTARLLLSRGASIYVSTRGQGLSDNRVTALHSACYSGLTPLSRFLIETGSQTDVESKDHFQMTPMSYAYYSGNWEAIELLTQHGATLNCRLGLFTLFKHACFYSRFNEALRFIELGVNVKMGVNKAGLSSLHCCCKQPYLTPNNNVRLPKRAAVQVSNRDKVVKILLEKGVNIESRNGKCETPLIQSAGYHFASIVDMLLAAGANPTARDISGAPALVSACAANVNSPEGELLRIVKILLPHTTGIKDRDMALSSLCATTSQLEDKVEIADLLLEHGSSSCLQRIAGQHMLSQAIAHGNPELADLLLDNGLRRPNSKELHDIIKATIQMDKVSSLKYIAREFPDAANHLDSGPLLHRAIMHVKWKCARFLIKAGAPVTYKGEDGRSCLWEAAAFRRTSLARLLLERGADPNELSDSNQSPLVEPMSDGNARMVRLFLDYGVDIHKRFGGIEGYSLADHAAHNHCTEALAEMVNHKAWWESTEAQRSDYVIRALLSSAQGLRSHLGEILECLLGPGGADPNTPCRVLEASPLHLALLFGQDQAVSILMRHGADVHRRLTTRSIPFYDTSPLEYAIKWSSVPFEITRSMFQISPLHNCDGFFVSNSSPNPDDSYDLDDSVTMMFDPAAARRTEPLDIQAIAMNYTRAACERHKPEVFRLIFGSPRGPDPNIRDKKSGDTPVALLCSAIETGLENATFTAEMIGRRTALCLIELLHVGADVNIPNNEGLTPLDRIISILEYSGPRAYKREVSRVWNMAFTIEGDVLREKTGSQGRVT